MNKRLKKLKKAVEDSYDKWTKTPSGTDEETVAFQDYLEKRSNYNKSLPKSKRK
jgi:hypothetical protein